MKVFVLLSRVPYPLEKGDKLRAYHQITELAKNHEVCVCCLSEGRENPEAIAHLRTKVQHVHVIRLSKLLIALRMLRAIFSDRPFQVHYFMQTAALRNVHRIITLFQPEHIYCQLTRCSEYVKNLHQYSKTLDYMDAMNAGLRRRAEIAPWYLRAFIREEARRMVNYENLIYEYFDHHTIISEQDRQLIYHPNRSRITVVPNGVDATFFSPNAEVQKNTDLLFTGNMSYPPNVDCAVRLAQEIMPLIRREMPGATLTIAGATPAPAVVALRNEHTTVTGWMEDIRQAYLHAKVFIAPMRIGSGLQNKLLEAMSMELPCITSSLAAQAMHDDAREALVTSDEPEAIAAQAVRLLRQPEERAQRGKAGRNTILRHFNWQATTQLLETLWNPTHP
jgi:sugar transferase (PEP-CTERM/EpsH1 system associated)